ncbi:DUF4232 domain-containing protein [Streptomyces sp. NPDC054975]
MRTARSTRWKTCTLGFAAVAALLSSTACQSGDTDDAKKPTASATPSSSSPSTATPSSGTPGATASKTPEPTAPAPTRSGEGGTTGVVACNDNDLSIATSVWRQDSGQHLLITATNFTDKACTLYHYPRIGFGAHIEGPLPAMGPKPKALATIGPKQKAYAGLFLYRGSEKTIAVEAVSIGYQDRVLGTNDDVAMLDVAFSKEIGFLNVGSNAKVTYWHRDRGAIEDILFRSGS